MNAHVQPVDLLDFVVEARHPNQQPDLRRHQFVSGPVKRSFATGAGRLYIANNLQLQMGPGAASILIQILLAFGIAVTGGALSATFARTHRRLCAFISLGAGTLLGVALCGIAPECWEALRGWFLPAAASGYLLFAIITKYIYHVCPACAASHFDEATTHRLAEFATAMMIALGIHCVVDGLSLAAGLEESRPVQLSITFAICVHKFPEGLALGALLLGGGVERLRMLGLVAAVEAMTIAGGLLGWFLLGNVPHSWLALTLALMLANACGGFLYLAVHAVLGEIFKHHKALVLGNFAAGFGVIAGLILYFHLRS
ncbi:MAG: ZIP family metal transporter [Verrucomicrobiota bacterium]|nr:ZIP family metal transporter [Verrucomicrobiota bacterium]